MREKKLLDKVIIQDIYDSNYCDGGFDEVEFGSIVAEYQHRKSLTLIREGLEKVENPVHPTDFDAKRYIMAYLNGFEDCRQKSLALLGEEEL